MLSLLTHSENISIVSFGGESLPRMSITTMQSTSQGGYGLPDLIPLDISSNFYELLGLQVGYSHMGTSEKQG